MLNEQLQSHYLARKIIRYFQKVGDVILQPNKNLGHILTCFNISGYSLTPEKNL